MDLSSGKPRRNWLKPEAFWLPGIFLLLLGLGNVLIGQLKMGQFGEALAELDSAQQYKEEVSSSPLMRMQMARKLADSRVEARFHYEERWNFYRTVAFGGKLVMSLSLLLFSMSCLALWLNPRPRRARLRLRRAASQRGISRIGLLFTVLILGAVVFLGFKVGNFFYCYYELEGLMEFQAKKAQEFTDQEIRDTVFTRIKELQIPIDDPEEIRINRVEQKIIIETKYNEVLYVTYKDKDYDLYTFRFHPRIEVPY